MIIPQLRYARQTYGKSYNKLQKIKNGVNYCVVISEAPSKSEVDPRTKSLEAKRYESETVSVFIAQHRFPEQSDQLKPSKKAMLEFYTGKTEEYGRYDSARQRKVAKENLRLLTIKGKKRAWCADVSNEGDICYATAVTKDGALVVSDCF